MKKVALVFILAVFLPSLVLAWLAGRSLRDQQFVLERQQSLLYQGVADSLSRAAGSFLADRQHDFAQQVETLLAGRRAGDLARSFDDQLRTNWPLAAVGFVVTLNGDILSPSPTSSPAALQFCTDNSKFLANRESAEVFWNSLNQAKPNGLAAYAAAPNASPGAEKNDPARNDLGKGNYGGKSTIRSVVPQQQLNATPKEADQGQYSKVAASEAEFRQIIGDATEGNVARFLENKLHVLLWYRPPSDPKFVFGAQLSMPNLQAGLQPIVREMDTAFQDDIVVALLDDHTRPVALSQPGFSGQWKHPFVATEIGEALPHWEVAVYLLHPARLSESVRSLKLTVGLLITLLLLAITAGSWLIVTDLNRQLTLARQKTDFVSNVSHELKTPLTSIRMFSEMLAEGRVADPAKQRTYLNIISAESARLSRLINNVLDFSRSDRGLKKYELKPSDLAAIARETVATYRPHLESLGFEIATHGLEQLAPVQGDRDALAQVIVNLLSNAEKYSGDARSIRVSLEPSVAGSPEIALSIQDRGPSVPRGCEEKIFEQFFRAHDSLSSGIPGSGLGLTLARQIARAHGGDVTYRPRPDGGSCFTLGMPLAPPT